ncbi:MAG: hypothetical protein WBF14_05880 [Candidatus Acidiferrales bacterium]
MTLSRYRRARSDLLYGVLGVRQRAEHAVTVEQQLAAMTLDVTEGKSQRDLGSFALAFFGGGIKREFVFRFDIVTLELGEQTLVGEIELVRALLGVRSSESDEGY